MENWSTSVSAGLWILTGTGRLSKSRAEQQQAGRLGRQQCASKWSRSKRKKDPESQCQRVVEYEVLLVRARRLEYGTRYRYRTPPGRRHQSNHDEAISYLPALSDQRPTTDLKTDRRLPAIDPAVLLEHIIYQGHTHLSWWRSRVLKPLVPLPTRIDS